MKKNYTSRIIPSHSLWIPNPETPLLLSYERLIKDVFRTLRSLKKAKVCEWQGFLGIGESYHAVFERTSVEGLTDFSSGYFTDKQPLSDTDVREITKLMQYAGGVDTSSMEVFKNFVTIVVKHGDEYHRVTIGSRKEDKEKLLKDMKAKAAQFFASNNYSSFFYNLGPNGLFNTAVDAIESEDYNTVACQILKLIREHYFRHSLEVVAAFCKTTVEAVALAEEGKGNTMLFFAMCAVYKIDPMALMQTTTIAITNKRMRAQHSSKQPFYMIG